MGTSIVNNMSFIPSSGMKNNSGPEFVYTTSQVSIAVPFLICQIRLHNVEGIVGNFNENF